MRKQFLVIFLVILGVVSNLENAQAARLKGVLNAVTPQNFKLLAVKKNGRSATASVAADGKFIVNVAKGGTLHLVQAAGQYHGPIVLPQRTKAYTQTAGIRGRIGKVTLKDGFAVVGWRLGAPLFQLTASVAFNKTTGPRGASKLGLVEKRRVANIQAASAGSDADKDGLPEILDIDDDGDLVLDVSESSTGAEAVLQPVIFSTLRLALSQTVNVHAAGASTSLIDSTIESQLRMAFLVRNNSNGSLTVNSVNVDCLGLSYCAPGSGTAVIRPFPSSPDTLWTSYDLDADGLPNLSLEGGTSTVPAQITVFTMANRSELKLGDTVLFKIATNNGKQEVPALLPFYFLTVPALKEVSSGGGSTTISYPVEGGGDGTSIGHPIVLASGSATFTFWKPQRLAVPGAESGDYIDIGRLRYGVTISPQGSTSVVSCEASDYSNPSSSLTFGTVVPGAGTMILEDQALDATADSANLLSFTLDIGTCLARAGFSSPNQKFSLGITANSVNNDQAAQQIVFQIP